MEVASASVVVNLAAAADGPAGGTAATHSVESLTVFRDRLLAGCTDGSLLVFADEEGSPPGFVEGSASTDGGAAVRAGAGAGSRGPLRLIETHSGFAKKPVLQLTAIGGSAQPSADLLLSLTDGVSLHTLPNVRLHSSLARTRGASAYRWRADDRRLCVACRKRLLVYKWDGVDLKELREVPLAEVPKALEWAGVDTVCLAFRREYCIASTATGDTRSVCPTGKHGEPSIVVLPCGEMLLMKDSVGIFVANDEGAPTRNHGISWSAVPDEVVLLSWPHALAIMPRMVEVRALHRRTDTDDTGSIALSQTLPLQGCLAVSADGRGDWANSVFVSSASGTLIHRIDVLPLGEQVRRLVEVGELEEAVEIAGLAPTLDDAGDAGEELGKVKKGLHRELADNLMRASDYGAAVANMARAGMGPEAVLSRFAALGLVPDGPAPAPAPEAPDRQRAMAALLPYLRERREDPLCPDGGLLDRALLTLLLHLGDSRLLSFVSSAPRVDAAAVVDALSAWGRDEELIAYLRASGMHRDALGRIRGGGGGGAAERMVGYIGQMGEAEVRTQVDEGDWTLILKSGKPCVREALPMMRAALPVDESMALLRAHAPALCLEFMEDVDASGGDGLNVELLELYIKAALQEREGAGVPHLEWERGGSEIRSRLAALVGRCTSRVGAEAALECFPAGALLRERCAVYRVLRYHKRALETLARELGEAAEAMAYADRVWEGGVGGTWIDQLNDDDGDEDGTAGEADAYGDEVVDDRDVYVVLLEVLDDAGEAAATSRLLNARCERLDPLAALSFVPAGERLGAIERFLAGALLMSSEAHRNLSITKNLCRSQNLTVRNRHMQLCKTRVAVSPESVCAVCGRRVGTSAFTVSTDGSLAHFGCHRDRAGARS